MPNIVSISIIDQFEQIQKDTFKYIKAVGLPITWIGDAVGMTRQTVKRKFENKTFTVHEFKKVAEYINSIK